MVAEEFSGAGDRRAELSPLPQGEPTVQVLKAPVDDGSFLNQNQAIHLRLIQSRGFTMHPCSLDPNSYGLLMPSDDASGLPLPIILKPLRGQDTNGGFVDFHHSFHPDVVLKTGSDEDRAVRMSRGQMLPRQLHEHYHNYFAGSPLPQTRQEKFITCVLACAGVLPRLALDFSGNGPRVRYTTVQEHEEIANSLMHDGGWRTEKNYYRSQIGIFFANYATEQSVRGEVTDKVIDAFLDLSDIAERTPSQATRRKELGNLMLRAAINISVEPVKPIHRTLQKDGLARRRATDLAAVVHDYFVRYRQADYFVALEQKYTAERAVA